MEIGAKVPAGDRKVDPQEVGKKICFVIFIKNCFYGKFNSDWIFDKGAFIKGSKLDRRAC